MLTSDRFEIVPVPGIVAQVARHLPVGAGVSVTSLPRHDVDDTVGTALELARAGFDAIPHVAAAQLASRRLLADVLARLADSPIETLFVIGGDGARPGDAFPDGRALLHAIRDAAGNRFRLGVAAYPEGHPHFDVDAGIEVLRAKAAAADYAVTQLCFDGAVLGDFVRRVAADGIPLPLWLGVPGRVGMRQLAAIAVRIGVGPSLAFARKGANARLLVGYDSAPLRSDVVAALGEGAALLQGFHVYTFNALEAQTGGASS